VARPAARSRASIRSAPHDPGAATGLAFPVNGTRPEVLPWAGGLTFHASESVTLTFRRANGDTGR
jgi:hypothetical protein